jgi:multiple sugar transport system ATP-binding protein
MTLADRIVAMHGGVVQQVGTPLDLYDRPANLFVAGFIGSPGMNFLDGEAVTASGQTSIRLADGTILPVKSTSAVANGAKLTLGIRPEHVTVVREGGMTASVELMEPTGFGIIVHASLHGLPFKLFTLDRAMLGSGPKIQVAFPTRHLHVFDAEGRRID